MSTHDVLINNKKNALRNTLINAKKSNGSNTGSSYNYKKSVQSVSGGSKPHTVNSSHSSNASSSSTGSSYNYKKSVRNVSNKTNTPIVKNSHIASQSSNIKVGSSVKLPTKNTNISEITHKQNTINVSSNKKSIINVQKMALRNSLIANERRMNNYTIKTFGANKNTEINNVGSKHFKINKDVENIITSPFSNSDDMSVNAVGESYKVLKASIIANAKLTALNQEFSKDVIKVSKSTISIGGKTYQNGKSFYKNVKNGTVIASVKGKFNIYKNMIGSNIKDKIRYSVPINSLLTLKDNVVITTLHARYGISQSVKFVRGLKSGTINITHADLRKFAGNSILKLGKGSYNTANKFLLNSQQLATSRPITGIARITGNVANSLANCSNDVGTQSISMATNSLKYTAKSLKSAYGFTNTVVNKTGNGIYKTSKGTIHLVGDLKHMGVKKTAKFYWKAHMKGAGKKVSQKISEKFTLLLKKIAFSPMFIGLLCFLLVSTTVGSGAVLAGTSVVGGIIEVFEELKEGLEDVYNTVKDAITDFLDSVCDWVKGLFGGGGSSDPELEIDVDIGSDMSVDDYLLGAVQLYKADYQLKLEKRYNTLLDDEGYHQVNLYNTRGDDIVVGDVNNADKGLMSDKDYVNCISPVWKAIIFGTIGSGFTGKQANDTSKSCFEAITDRIERPRVDLNGDGVADYLYCDGSTSLNEGENDVYTTIGSQTIHDNCLNHSDTLYHDSDSGMDCCHTVYHCGGHTGTRYCVSDWTLYNPVNCGCTNPKFGYKSLGHTTKVTFCAYGQGGNHFDRDKGTCDNYETQVRYEISGYTSYGAPIYDYSKPYEVYRCKGHGGEVVYDWTGIVETIPTGSTDSYETYYKCNGENYTYYCYSGTTETSVSTCTNQISEFYCTGYQKCLGHKIMDIYIGSEGFTELLNKKFLNRISELKSKATLTEAEQEELSNLQMYYEYAQGVGAIDNSDINLDDKSSDD